MTLLALLATHAAVALAGWTLGRGRNAAVRGEIARVGAMFVDEMKDRRSMPTQKEIDELTKRLDKAEAEIERLQERLAALEAPPRPVQVQHIPPRELAGNPGKLKAVMGNQPNVA